MRKIYLPIVLVGILFLVNLDVVSAYLSMLAASKSKQLPIDTSRRCKMPGACGLACEICGFPEKGLCPISRCVFGIDPKALEKREKFKAAVGHPCFILECAINKKVDHCFRCGEFPCEIHYKQEIYSHKLLDIIKGMLGKK